VELPSDFKTDDNSIDENKSGGDKKSGESFFKKNMLYIIIAILAIAITFLLYNRKKRKV
jgi:LPXTG cell wall anchor motif